MIVDDEDVSLVLLRGVLGSSFDFEHAASGEAALTALKTTRPAVILMDIEMGSGMNGYETCRAIKDSKITKNIPVMFISAHTETEDRLKAYACGGDDYVSKPFNAKEINYKISLALANQQKRNELAEKAHRATNLAMTSMREAANTGAILGFLSDITQQSDLEDVAATTLRTLKKFELDGAVQLRVAGGHVSRSSAGGVLTDRGYRAG
jgi:CheY-like chemotaxis protein